MQCTSVQSVNLYGVWRHSTLCNIHMDTNMDMDTEYIIIYYKSTTTPFILFIGALLDLYGYITFLLQFHVLSSGRLLLPKIDSKI